MILSKSFGLKATKVPLRASEAVAAGSEVVMTSTAVRPAWLSCRNRRRIADPPERNISTLMPVSASNSLTILLACSIGVEVYQTTVPSFLAAARSTSEARTGSAAGMRASAQATVSAMKRDRHAIVTSSPSRLRFALAGRGLSAAQVARDYRRFCTACYTLGASSRRGAKGAEMRFFTRNLWLRTQSRTPWKDTHLDWDRTFAGYRAQLEAFRPRLSADAFESFVGADLHDGELLELTIVDGSRPAPVDSPLLVRIQGGCGSPRT